MAMRSVPPGFSPPQEFSASNLAYLADLYEAYLQDADSVSPDVRQFFAQTDVTRLFADAAHITKPTNARGVPAAQVPSAVSAEYIQSVLAAKEFIRNIRDFGHLAGVFPPTADTPKKVPELQPETYGLTEAILRDIPAKWIWPTAPESLQTTLDVVHHLQTLYTGVLTFDIAHVYDLEERAWLERMVETGSFRPTMTDQQRVNLLKRLMEVDGFEKFIHRTYAGQKRFSIEGVDCLVPMLDALVHVSVAHGTKDIMIGMAHRGRLNVLAHVLGKPYEKIFAEFQSSPNKELMPSEGSEGINFGWSGDVKYHLGAYRTVTDEGPIQAHIRLANNPSHLEFVNPVVLGFTRAAQDDRSKAGPPAYSPTAGLGILVHGDAAFPGEGVVAETFNFSQINGYKTGGTIHIIANNRLGFTAEENESRSTLYASDLAKGFAVPIVHVSADQPEACLAAVRLAYMYRMEFGKDFLIDLVGYRRWGHNEMDDPNVTQPTLYKRIQPHPTAATLYATQLTQSQVITDEEVARLQSETHELFRSAHAKVNAVSAEMDPRPWESHTLAPKPVSMDTLQTLNEGLLKYPAGFTVYPKLAKVLERRKTVFPDGQVDWAHAEALALASILADGTPIRFTGQDTERGTFAHRHLVLHDPHTGSEYVPLQSLEWAKASFAVHNSPLTETAVLGFEYGYNVQAPQTLVLWEAQFGDFANVAQVIIDQFIVSGRAKWGEASGIVMLLPHGYEGQGPEHSSGRVERFLQLCANSNMTVANVTNAAQYFHLLRTQAALLGTTARPLVVMTPKSLLRNPAAASKPLQLAQGNFERLLDVIHPEADANATRVVLSSGKVGVDFTAKYSATKAASTKLEWLAHARVEQLYPFPEDEVKALLTSYPKLKEVVWLQEEPENMGAWTYIRPYLQRVLPAGAKLRYVGRAEQGSPAEGHAPAHNREQARILDEAMQPFESERN